MISRTKNSIITIATLLGLAIWLMDGVLDYLFFYEGSLLGLIITDVPPHEIYIRLFWFGGLLVTGFFASRLINDRDKALNEKDDLETLLRAVRKVNQLLVRENDRESLIKGVCSNLIETRDYGHVWVVLLDDSNNLLNWAQEGVGKEFSSLLNQIEEGQIPQCIQEPLNNSRVITNKDPESTCGDCAMLQTYQEYGAINMRLEYNNKVFGLLSASTPTRLLDNVEELNLFREVAGDIAFALHQMEVENELRRSEAKFRSYVENAPLGVHVVDEKGRYLEVNQAACEMTGYSREELLEMKFSDLHPAEALEETREEYEDLLKGEDLDLELPYVKKNGDRGHVMVNAVQLAPDRYLGFTLDITERKEAKRKLEAATLETLQALNRTIEAKDKYTGEHIDRVQEISVKIGEEIGLSEGRISQLKYASILHDIGKIGVSDSILGKPEQLSKEEWVEIEKHPKIGERIVGQVENLERAAKIIGEHQEYYDGSGYPQGLEGEEITLEARIVAVADAWDAMRTDRPYRKALPREEAIKELKENAGTQFDPRIVDIFMTLITEEKVDQTI